jgi:hypothetical protein
MTDKPNGTADDQLQQAFKILANSEASDSEADEALTKLASVLPKTGPSPDLSRRIMAAVRHVQLPPGRRPLRARHRVSVIAGSAALAAAAAAAVVMTGRTAAEAGVARIFAFAIQTALLLLHSLHFTFDAWDWIQRTGQILMVIITATPMLSVLVGMAVISGLSLAGLTRLVSSSQGRS